MCNEDREVNHPDSASSVESNRPNIVVVNEIGNQEEGGETKRSDHQSLVKPDVTVSNLVESKEKEDSAPAVQNGIHQG